MSQAIGLLVVVTLVAASAYFVAVEFSFTAANRNRLLAAQSAGDRKAGAALKVLKRLSFCLSGAQLGITFAALLTGFVAEPVFAALLEPLLSLAEVPEGRRLPIALTFGFVFSTFALMVLGELAPKNLAIAIPETTARRLARSTLLFMRVGG
ncbi:MAG: CNNM domain-containing protein, partial [Actinomycetota bacterium]|nr:CNNM domain-containing protein [Actinomycetota bacterium]